MKREWRKSLLSLEFETKMIRISKPIKQLREEFDEGEDGELLLTLR